ncbi:MAG: hypothetical protein K1W16_15190 [Lachnospiraceae bacterium]|jgi:hypothetical protein
MKHSFILWLAVSVIVMLVLPWLAVTFIKGDAAMVVCFLLFYVVNPIYSVMLGTFAGRDIRYLGSLPVISALLFLAGTWIFFDIGEIAFIQYMMIYLILGVATMLIFRVFRKKRRDRI